MNIKIYRLLFIILFSLSFGLLISKRFFSKNKKINVISLEQKNDPIQTNSDKNLPMLPNHTSPAVNNRSAQSQPRSNYKSIIPDCLNISIQKNDTLKSIADNNKWFSDDSKLIIGKNLIFDFEGREKRISLSPSASKKTWVIKSFDVDHEALPILINEELGLTYQKAIELIADYSQTWTLKSDEHNLEVETPHYSGSVLFINKIPQHIKLMNQTDRKYLECLDQYCACNT